MRANNMSRDSKPPVASAKDQWSSSMNFHPYAEIFPLIDDGDFDELSADIKAHGLREPIWLYEDQILDGRNRYMASCAAEVEPQYRQFKGDNAAALAFVISVNMRRRHLNESQRAMAAARIATLKDGQRSDRVQGVPIGPASKMTGASERSTKRARKVLEEGSKQLQKAVDSGEVSVSKAAAVVDLPKAQQLKAAKSKPAETASASSPEPCLGSPPDLDKCEPQDDERAHIEQAEKDYTASIDKVMAADDKLAAAHAEIKRQAAEIATLKLSRNQYQNQCAELIKRVKSLQRQLEKPAANGKHAGTNGSGVHA